MYRRDRKFLNRDGSLNLEAAVAAGRNARSKDLFEGCGIVSDAAVRLVPTVWRAFAALYSRLSSSRIFQGKAA